MQWVIILTWLFKNRGIFLNITFGNTINMTKVIKIIKIMISIYCRMSVQVCWVRPPGDKDEPSDQFTDAHIQSSCVRWGANYKMLMSPQSKASIVSFKIITTNNIIGRNIFFQTSPKLKKTQTQVEFLVEHKTEQNFDHFCPELQLFNFLW